WLPPRNPPPGFFAEAKFKQSVDAPLSVFTSRRAALNVVSLMTSNTVRLASDDWSIWSTKWSISIGLYSLVPCRHVANWLEISTRMLPFGWYQPRWQISTVSAAN